MTRYTTDSEASGILSHQPSSWLEPKQCDDEFQAALRKIFEESILGEIDNVIQDAQRCTGGTLDHRGYVILLALMCALDAISSYGYGDRSGAQIPDFIHAHFSKGYHSLADKIWTLYRNGGVHNWHLFSVGISADGPAITYLGEVPCINILLLRDAFQYAVNNYFEKLKTDVTLRSNTLRRYVDLRKKAKRAW
jgi:hypothetical protein